MRSTLGRILPIVLACTHLAVSTHDLSPLSSDEIDEYENLATDPDISDYYFVYVPGPKDLNTFIRQLDGTYKLLKANNIWYLNKIRQIGYVLKIPVLRGKEEYFKMLLDEYGMSIMPEQLPKNLYQYPKVNFENSQNLGTSMGISKFGIKSTQQIQPYGYRYGSVPTENSFHFRDYLHHHHKFIKRRPQAFDFLIGHNNLDGSRELDELRLRNQFSRYNSIDATVPQSSRLGHFRDTLISQHRIIKRPFTFSNLVSKRDRTRFSTIKPTLRLPFSKPKSTASTRARVAFRISTVTLNSKANDTKDTSKTKPYSIFTTSTTQIKGRQSVKDSDSNLFDRDGLLSHNNMNNEGTIDDTTINPETSTTYSKRENLNHVLSTTTEINPETTLADNARVESFNEVEAQIHADNSENCRFSLSETTELFNKIIAEKHLVPSLDYPYTPFTLTETEVASYSASLTRSTQSEKITFPTPTPEELLHFTTEPTATETYAETSRHPSTNLSPMEKPGLFDNIFSIFKDSAKVAKLSFKKIEEKKVHRSRNGNDYVDELYN